MRVLLVEDDIATANAIQSDLQKNKSNVCDIASTGKEALDLAYIYPYDVIILDLCLPDADGTNILSQLREKNINSPVLVLSGVQDVRSKINAFEIGADDYVVKPFSKKELHARLNVMVRKTNGHLSSVIKIGKFALDLNKSEVLYEVDPKREQLKDSAGNVIKDHDLRDASGNLIDAAGNKIEIDPSTKQYKPMKLTCTEYSLMEALMLRKGATVTKSSLMDRIYGGDEPELKTMDVFTCKVRKKMDMVVENGSLHIVTVWGKGYSFQDPNGSDVYYFEEGSKDIKISKYGQENQSNTNKSDDTIGSSFENHPNIIEMQRS
jgi:two-component system cell cycle response regulator CtrA